MSANRLYLVCDHHATPEEALLLGERAGNDAGFDAPNLRKADKWFAKHANCGQTKDHFSLAYNRPQNWDVPVPAQDTAAGAVKVAMALNGAH